MMPPFQCKHCTHLMRDHEAPWPASNGLIDVIRQEEDCDCMRNLGLGDFYLDGRPAQAHEFFLGFN